ncbi:MAG: hypothetical protein U1F67_00050 [Rubrivivax sp.]
MGISNSRVLVFAESGEAAAAIAFWAGAAGHDVVAADSEDAAARALRAQHPDIVFSSHPWPRGAAMPTLSALKAARPSLRFVFVMDGPDAAAEAPLARAAGADAVLARPLERAAILRQIEAARRP